MTLQDSVRTAVVATCDSWDIEFPDPDDITISETGTRVYEVAVPVTNRVLLEELLDDHGRLLMTKNDIEVYIKGFDDGQLLLEANPL